MAFTFIASSKANSDSGVTSLTTSTALNVAAGDLLIGVATWEDNAEGTLTMQAVGGANVFTLLPNAITSGLNFIRPGYKLSATSDSNATFTVDFGATRGYASWLVMQFRPQTGYTASFDSGPSAATGSSATATSGDITTVAANTLAVGMFKLYNSTIPSASTIGGETAELIQITSLSYASYAQFTSQQSGVAAVETLGASVAWTADVMAFTESNGATNYSLTATGLTTGAPSTGTPAVAQAHSLTATGLSTTAPSLGAPAMAQSHALAATGLATSAPILGSPALAIAGTLLPVGIDAGIPVLGAPAVAQNQAFGVNGISTSVPTLGAPSLIGAVIDYALAAVGFLAGIPSLGSPALTETIGQESPIAILSAVAKICGYTVQSKAETISASSKTVSLTLGGI